MEGGGGGGDRRRGKRERRTDVGGPFGHGGFGFVGEVVVFIDPVADLFQAVQFVVHAQLRRVARAVGKGDGREVVVVEVFFGDANSDICGVFWLDGGFLFDSGYLVDG